MKRTKNRDNSVVSLQGTVTWKYCQDPKADKWIAICDPFRITVEAETLRELHESMLECVDEMFRDLTHSGDLEKFLEEHGWSAVNALPPHGKRGDLTFDLPLQTRRVSIRDLEEAFC